MDEATWLASTDPAAMLDWRQGSNPLREPCPLPPLSDRKLRLWVEACREATARSDGWVWDLHLNDQLQYAVEEWSNPPMTEGVMASMDVRAAILRCIVGNPFRLVVLPWRCRGCGIPCGPPTAGYYCVKCGEDEALCPWLSWSGGTVPRLAEALYADNDFSPGRLGVLADALEEAGANQPCDNPNCGPPVRRTRHNCAVCHGTGHVPLPLIAHLRSPGPHCRGCWCVDLLIGSDHA